MNTTDTDTTLKERLSAGREASASVTAAADELKTAQEAIAKAIAHYEKAQADGVAAGRGRTLNEPIRLVSMASQLLARVESDSRHASGILGAMLDLVESLDSESGESAEEEAAAQ